MYLLFSKATENNDKNKTGKINRMDVGVLK